MNTDEANLPDDHQRSDIIILYHVYEINDIHVYKISLK